MNVKMAKEWLKASYLDLESIKHIIKAEYLTSIVAFHAQQSVEKSLKALIEYEGKQVPKQHDLIKLKTLVVDILDIEDEDLLDSLNALYIDSRYPGEFGLLPYGQPTLEDAKEFYELSLRVYEDAAKIITGVK